MADVQGALDSALKPHVDEDTYEYISSLLDEDPYDEDAREAVSALIIGSMEDDQEDAEQVCLALFSLLDLGKDDDNAAKNGGDNDGKPNLRKLDQAVTMKENDIQTFASGLRAESKTDEPDEESKETQIAAFYANMIEVGNAAAQSERVRRKARQKEIRLKMEAEERQRAITQAMAMLETQDTESAETLMENSTDNAQDIHFKNLDLANLRGGGPDLLRSAGVTFARGRRYGYVHVLLSMSVGV